MGCSRVAPGIDQGERGPQRGLGQIASHAVRVALPTALDNAWSDISLTKRDVKSGQTQQSLAEVGDPLVDPEDVGAGIVLREVL